MILFALVAIESGKNKEAFQAVGAVGQSVLQQWQVGVKVGMGVVRVGRAAEGGDG